MRHAGEELLPSAAVVFPESRMAQRRCFAFSVSRPLPSEFALFAGAIRGKADALGDSQASKNCEVIQLNPTQPAGSWTFLAICCVGVPWLSLESGLLVLPDHIIALARVEDASTVDILGPSAAFSCPCCCLCPLDSCEEIRSMMMMSTRIIVKGRPNGEI
ncbi:hypothetical protein SKAU_G00255440 [Synaphobranchus kaupii]|uniref:Uncharacterized protein n=1 Tax=Synaphobranchus kaupii TaxID=118154 RepID=A0A9Q1F3P1_SYNKA|nr:hypothetical protein SKAU_G00255440 [Synaphobranchus kaupii]